MAGADSERQSFSKANLKGLICLFRTTKTFKRCPNFSSTCSNCIFREKLASNRFKSNLPSSCLVARSSRYSCFDGGWRNTLESLYARNDISPFFAQLDSTTKQQSRQRYEKRSLVLRWQRSVSEQRSPFFAAQNCMPFSSTACTFSVWVGSRSRMACSLHARDKGSNSQTACNESVLTSLCEKKGERAMRMFCVCMTRWCMA